MCTYLQFAVYCGDVVVYKMYMKAVSITFILTTTLEKLDFKLGGLLSVTRNVFPLPRLHVKQQKLTRIQCCAIIYLISERHRI